VAESRMVNLSGWAINELPKWIVFVSHLPDISTLFAGGGTSERGSGHVELAFLLSPPFQGLWMGINIALFIYQFNLFQSTDRFFYMRLRTRVWQSTC